MQTQLRGLVIPNEVIRFQSNFGECVSYIGQRRYFDLPGFFVCVANLLANASDVCPKMLWLS